MYEKKIYQGWEYRGIRILYAISERTVCHDRQLKIEA